MNSGGAQKTPDNHFASAPAEPRAHAAFDNHGTSVPGLGSGAQLRRDDQGEDAPASGLRAHVSIDSQGKNAPEADLFRLTYRLIEDLQRVRLSHGNRIRQVLPLIPGHINPPRGTPTWEAFFKISSDLLHGEEARVLKLARQLLQHDPVGQWALSQRGMGPALAVSILGECWPLSRFANPQKLWAYAGLHVIDGKAAKRKKGQKANWNSRLKTRLWLFSTSVLKAGEGPWRDVYDARKRYEYERLGAHLCPEDQAVNAPEPTPDGGAQVSHDDHKCFAPASDLGGVQKERDDRNTTAPSDSRPGAHVRVADQTGFVPGAGAHVASDDQRMFAPRSEEHGEDHSGVDSHPTDVLSKLHIHNRALRHVQKLFLIDLWRVAHEQPPRIGIPETRAQ